MLSPTEQQDDDTGLDEAVQLLQALAKTMGYNVTVQDLPLYAGNYSRKQLISFQSCPAVVHHQLVSEIDPRDSSGRKVQW